MPAEREYGTEPIFEMPRLRPYCPKYSPQGKSQINLNLCQAAQDDLQAIYEKDIDVTIISGQYRNENDGLYSAMGLQRISLSDNNGAYGGLILQKKRERNTHI